MSERFGRWNCAADTILAREGKVLCVKSFRINAKCVKWVVGGGEKVGKSKWPQMNADKHCGFLSAFICVHLRLFLLFQVLTLERRFTATKIVCAQNLPPFRKTRREWAYIGSRSGRDIPLDGNAARLLPRFRHVVGELHPQQVIHVRTKGLFDAECHFWRQSGLAAEKVGEGCAPHFQNLRRLRDAEPERFNNLRPDEVARMGRVLHGHCGPPSDSQSNRYRWLYSPLRGGEKSAPSFP